MRRALATLGLCLGLLTGTHLLGGWGWYHGQNTGVYVGPCGVEYWNDSVDVYCGFNADS